MKKEEKIKAILEQNHGYITTEDFLKLKISKPMIKKYMDLGLVRKVHHGLYIDNTKLEDDYYIIQKQYPQVVFSHQTAFYLWKLSTNLPITLDITVKKDKKVRGEFLVHHVSEKFYDIGITEIVSPFGNSIRIYDVERCICDLLRMNIEEEKREKILQRYLLKKEKDIDKLLEYSKIFHIYDQVSKIVAK